METPPTTMIHSPCGALAATAGIVCENAIATIAINGRNRLVMIIGQHYLCARQAAQLRAEGYASARPEHAEACPSVYLHRALCVFLEIATGRGTETGLAELAPPLLNRIDF